MFDSQMLETLIGLALMFFVMASLASVIVEGISQLMAKRAKDLKRTIGQMLTGSIDYDATAKKAVEIFEGTAVYRSATIASAGGRGFVRRLAGPSYLSARAFVDALDKLRALPAGQPAAPPVCQAARTGIDPATVKNALAAQLTELDIGGEDLTSEARTRLESWYDETMDRLSGAYKRWASAVLFLVGLLLAGIGNVSAYHVALTLWSQPTVRQAALDAAEQAATKADGSVIESNVTTVKNLAELGLPVGWPPDATWEAGWLAPQIGGWLVPALLITLGAPFWFDALSRLVALRATGAKPPRANDDPASPRSADRDAKVPRSKNPFKRSR